MNIEDSRKVKKFWQERALDNNMPEDEVTHQDVWQRWLEIETIRNYLRHGDRVIDIGCGNGLTTKRLAPLVTEIIGIDYSQEMIARARQESPPDKQGTMGKMRFEVFDVLDLAPSSFGLFDTAVSERCLINLPDWKSQKKAIIKIASVLKKGGRFIFVEGSKNGRNNLNKLRKAVDLLSMPPVWHNVDFDNDKTIDFLKKSFQVEHSPNFGVYDFLSRVVHPLLIAPEQPVYNAKINELAAKLARLRQDFDDLSRILFLVLKKI